MIDCMADHRADNVALIRLLYKQLFNEWNFDIVEDFFDRSFRSTEIPESLPAGPEGVRAFYEGLRSAFGDLTYVVEDIIAEGDKVVVRWSWRGHHTGTFRGMSPTGRAVHLSGIAIYRIEDGKAVQRWVSGDTLTLMRTLGFELTAPKQIAGS
jgi:predicted ester cyclase